MRFHLTVLILAATLVAINYVHAFGRGRITPPENPGDSPVVNPLPSDTPTPAPEIKLGDISAGGSGCAGGLLYSEMSQDNMTVRLVFNQFLALVSGDQRLDRKTCSVAIPILQAAAGKKLVISKVVMSGTREITTGAKGKAEFEAFFAGSQGQRVEASFEASHGPFSLVQNDGAALACDETGIFRINASVLVQKLEGLGSVRADEITVSFKLVPCQAE